MKILLILFLAFSFFNCHSNTHDKIISEENIAKPKPIHFRSSNASYNRDSLFIATTVWQFIDKEVGVFDYYKQYNVPFNKISIDIDSIFYSPDSLKIFAFVIETDPDVQHNNIDKYVYSGNSIIGFRPDNKSYWTLYNFDEYSIAGLETYNDVRKSFRNFYLTNSDRDGVFGKFKEAEHYYWNNAKQDYDNISFDYDVDDKNFWDSCIIWRKGIPIPGYYSFQVKDQSVMNKIFLCLPPKQILALHFSGISICAIFSPLLLKTVTPIPVRYRFPCSSNVIPSDDMFRKIVLLESVPPSLPLLVLGG